MAAVEVLDGDITKLEVDAIANAANTDLAHGGGVAGWVRNQPDGSVEAVFEGEPDMVAAMVRFVRDGPGSSDVARIDVDEEEPASLRGFKVA